MFAFYRRTRLEFYSSNGVWPKKYHNMTENPIGFSGGKNGSLFLSEERESDSKENPVGSSGGKSRRPSDAPLSEEWEWPVDTPEEVESVSKN